jgi:hypothetical protein
VDAPRVGRRGSAAVLALCAAGGGLPKRWPPASAVRRRRERRGASALSTSGVTGLGKSRVIAAAMLDRQQGTRSGAQCGVDCSECGASRPRDSGAVAERMFWRLGKWLAAPCAYEFVDSALVGSEAIGRSQA